MKDCSPDRFLHTWAEPTVRSSVPQIPQHSLTFEVSGLDCEAGRKVTFATEARNELLPGPDFPPTTDSSLHRSLRLEFNCYKCALRPQGGREGVVFQMIDDNNATREERKRIFWYKVGLFLAASAAVVGVMYFVFTGAITT